jgi:hypothetical protein
MSIDDDDVEATVPAEDTEEYEVATTGGSGYTGGAVTTTLLDGTTTLALNRWREDYTLTVEHEDDALRIGAGAHLSEDGLRDLRDALDEVLGELGDEEPYARARGNMDSTPGGPD